MNQPGAPYAVVQLDGIAPVACPCGLAQRAFADVSGAPASVHVVRISRDSRPHYHRRLTEIYVVLEGEGWVELDGQRVAVRPLSAVMIRPLCRHRAVGAMAILNIVIPPFDSADEWFD